MPVIVREGSWRIWIYTDDHGHPHVHVCRGDAMVKVLLPTGESPARPVTRRRVTNREVTQGVRLVEKHRAILTSAWSAIHGFPQPD